MLTTSPEYYKVCDCWVCFDDELPIYKLTNKACLAAYHQRN